MAIAHIHTYLVHPGKSSESTPKINGVSVALSGKLFSQLEEIYRNSETECDIAISFNAGPGGEQTNACRELIVEYVGSPTLAVGRKLAEKLERVTTRRSGLGLLFLISGKEGTSHKLVLSRFPTTTAILAEEDAKALSVQFLERVFMKSGAAYKAVVYSDASLKGGFWTGQAIDRQIDDSHTRISDYWIKAFLESDFLTTPAAGTRRLATALRVAAKVAPELAARQEIAAAATLAHGLKNEKISVRGFIDRFGLSEEARTAVLSQLKSPSVADEQFKFDSGEFSAQIAYRSVELDSGAVLTAEASDFDSVFETEVIDEKKRQVRYSAQGKVVSERLKRQR